MIDQEQLIDALKLATNNFSQGFTTSTLMDWNPKYDKDGASLNSNPNYQQSEVSIQNITYYFVRRGWLVRVWDKPVSYMALLNDNQDFIIEIDLTPEYLKDDKRIPKD
jgi:hypothetical protein